MSQSIDSLLANWPRPSRGPGDRTEKILSRISELEKKGGAEGLVDVSDETLFGPPMAKETDTVHDSLGQNGKSGQTASVSSTVRPEKCMSSERERNRQSFQELAKLAGSVPPQSGAFGTGERKEDSGVINLRALAEAEERAAAEVKKAEEARAAESARIAEAQAASVRAAELARAKKAEEEAQSFLSTPPVALSAEAQAVVAAPAPTLRSMERPASKKPIGLFVVAGTMALAAAAGFVVWKSSQSNKGPGPVVIAAAPAKENPKASEPAKGEGKAEPAAAPQDEKAEPAQAGQNAANKLAALPPGVIASQQKKEATTPQTAEVAKVEAELAKANKQANIPTGNMDDKALAEQMQKAVGTNGSAQMQPAAQENTGPAAGSVPTKPSQGAVQGAIGGVLGAARACLGPDDPIARATVVFQSDGSVQSVSVSGGGGKEGCIMGALKRARVSPFANPSFTTSVTVRAN